MNFFHDFLSQIYQLILINRLKKLDNSGYITLFYFVLALLLLSLNCECVGSHSEIISIFGHYKHDDPVSIIGHC
jgi:uncharacterized protein (UPF0332 family)